jgi:thiol-disulfide isomerase/thioredoxin
MERPTGSWALGILVARKQISMGLNIAVCLQLALLATGGETYAEACKTTAEKGCPLVVMVGASWCPACQEMKNSVIPEVRRQGTLHKVAFAQVDLDEEEELGAELIDGGPVPQILMYRKTGQGWKLRRLVGGQDARAVEEFIAQGVEEDRKTLPARSSPGWHPRREKPGEARTASANAAQEGTHATTK